MCRIQTCCCCLNLRQGSYLSAVYSIILGGFGVFGCVVFLQQIDGQVSALAELNINTNNIQSAGETSKIVLYVGLGLFAAWVLTAFFIFCGVRSNVRGFLLPWIIVSCVIMGLAAYGIGTSTLHISQIIKDTYKLTQFVFNCVMFLLNVYAVMCVSAFYKAHLQVDEEENVPEAVPMKADAYYGPDAV